MRILFVNILFFLAVNVSFGQEFSSRVWHKGWIVTIDNDTIYGDIKYEMDANSIQVVADNKKVKTYSSKGIIYVQIYDTIVSNYRHFYSVPYQVSSDFRAPVLFEVLYEGPTTLLSREKIVVKTDTYNQSFYYNSPSTSSEVLEYTYYFAFSNGDIKMYTGKKGEIYTLLEKHSDKIRDYIKKNKLDTKEVRDLIRILAFYNSI